MVLLQWNRYILPVWQFRNLLDYQRTGSVYCFIVLDNGTNDYLCPIYNVEHIIQCACEKECANFLVSFDSYSQVGGMNYYTLIQLLFVELFLFLSIIFYQCICRYSSLSVIADVTTVTKRLSCNHYCPSHVWVVDLLHIYSLHSLD